MKFLTREMATAFLRDELGVPTSSGTLKDLASKGRGPKFVVINGRALYTREDLVRWVQDHVSPS